EEALAKRVEERRPRVDLQFLLLAVHVEGDLDLVARRRLLGAGRRRRLFALPLATAEHERERGDEGERDELAARHDDAPRRRDDRPTCFRQRAADGGEVDLAALPFVRSDDATPLVDDEETAAARTQPDARTRDRELFRID